jgi:hypothetical protein
MSPELSSINNLEQLQAAIKVTKHSIRQREAHFNERWQSLPQETLKATIGSVIPFFRNATVAKGTWSVLKTVFRLVYQSENTWANAAKAMGINFLVDRLFSWFTTKKPEQQQPAEKQ